MIATRVAPPSDVKRLSVAGGAGTHRASFWLVLSRRLNAAILGLALAASVLAGGCTSPTLPLPPPSLSELRLDNDQVTVEGTATPGAMVFAYNRDLGKGAIDDADEPDGYFLLVMEGREGDLIVVWSQFDDQASPTIERIVPPAR